MNSSNDNNNQNNENQYPPSPINHTQTTYCNNPTCSECLEKYYKHYDYLIRTNNLQYSPHRNIINENINLQNTNTIPINSTGYINYLMNTIEQLKNDISQLKTLHYVDRNDINIANRFIDKSIYEISKLTHDINNLNVTIKNNGNIINSRINNAYKKIYDLEKKIKLNKLRTEHNSDNEDDDKLKNNKKLKSDNIITKIIKIDDPTTKGFPQIFQFLGSMLSPNIDNKDKYKDNNDLIDSEDDYDDTKDIYENINNIDSEIQDIIEINLNINTINDLLDFAIQFESNNNKKNNMDKDIEKTENIEDTNSEKLKKKKKKNKSVDDIAEEAFKKVINDLFGNDKSTDKSSDDKIFIKFFNEKDTNSDENKNTITEKNDKKIDNDKSLPQFYEYNGKKYSIDIEKLLNLIEPLKKLKKVIGMNDVKKQILDMILYYLQNFEGSTSDMLHTSIEGPPGVGKTKLGRILAQIYSGLGIISSKRFVKVRRTDLIGKYLGHTAHKTQEVINEAEGGVLFIDEAYSLGDNEGRDSYSKECIDIINQNLTEKKKKLIVIIAGYTNQLDKTFFAMNEGLRRRFPFRFTIDDYNEKEMTDIFYSKIKKINWKLNNDINRNYLESFFKENKEKFKNFGGDIETLVMNCKMTHASRVIGKSYIHKKIIIKDDFIKAYDKFNINKNKTDDNYEYIKKTLYS